MVGVFFFKGDFPSCSWLGLVTFEREIEREKERERERELPNAKLGF